MMYKCCECGHLFEEGEQSRWTEDHGEKWDGCPLCRGGYEEVRQCKECGDWHTDDELYSGWCEKCLRETINYGTFFEYCEANKEHQYLDIFVMQNLFDMDCPNNITDKFHKLMIEEYKRTVRFVEYYKKLLDKKSYHDFLDECIRFIMDDDGEIGRENYADWLNSKKEVK